MKKSTTNEVILREFLGFDFEAKVKVNYDGMRDNTYHVHEIVGSRVTIKLGAREIDFNISEVELRPIGYCDKESKRIREFYYN